MTLLRDLIPIPERVHQSDFVLRLTQGLEDAERTLQDYVVTDQLVGCFDEALGIIQKAVATGVSKAVYLNGSFGSGKSHFMAVLSLLLAGNPRARSIGELSAVVARHNGWTEGRRFLLVPYHMIGSTRPGVRHPGRLRRARPAAAPGGAGAGLLRGRAPVPRRRGDARAPGRRGLLRRAERVGGGRRLRLGQPGRGLGRGELGVGPTGAPGRGGADPAGRGPDQGLLQLLSDRRGGAGGVLPVAGPGSRGALQARPGPGLRRGDPVPRRADPVAREPGRGHGLREQRGGQALQAGGGAAFGPTDPTGELRGPPAGPAGAGGREPGGRPAPDLRRRPEILGGAVREDPPGGPQPAGDRGATGAAAR